MINSRRVKLRSEREALRLAQAEQALEGRLRQAEVRHSEHIKNTKKKANNENSKVSEIIFINNINSETLVEQLQQKVFLC